MDIQTLYYKPQKGFYMFTDSRTEEKVSDANLLYIMQHYILFKHHWFEYAAYRLFPRKDSPNYKFFQDGE